MYNALVELLLRFEKDWSNGNIDKSKVMIVHFDRMMNNFDELMDDIIKFTGQESSDYLLNEISAASVKQKAFKSKHKYDLEKFGLNESQIRKDCKDYYDTFIN